MSFPKISRTIEQGKEKIKVKFLTENFELILDREKCTGCGTCSRVCPKEAISRGPVAATRRFPTTEDIIPEVYDPEKCVFCGTCVYMCPFGALTLKKNGEEVPLKELQIVKEEVVPKLEIEYVDLENGKKAKSYVKGSIEVIDEECAKECSSCATVCPTGAIKIAERPEKAWEFSKNVEVVDEDACIVCGACDNACPTGAIRLKVEEVNTSGEFSELFWPPLVERLKTLRWSEGEEVSK